ncbi:hypothetical protein AH06_103 [Erwinia phage AH06]|nr:hypothetical protein AH06_103 [Erwinia phage AH06]
MNIDGHIYEVEVGVTYLSPSGLPFEVLYIAAHGQDCTVPMIIYRNLTATYDKPIGQIWTTSESLFLKQFRVAP